MTTDLIPHPRTGEALDLTADTETLATWVDELREHERAVKEIRDRIGEELVRRMDRRGRWTTHTDAFTISAPSPEAAQATEWDVDALRATLGELVAEGLIDPEAVDEVVTAVISWKVRPGGVKALSKISPEIAERLGACGQKVDKARRVTVKLK